MLISFVRTIILFFLVTVTLRLMGKRQIGELEPTELVVTILVSDLVAIPMQNLSIPLVAGIAPVMIVLAINVLVSHILLKNVRLRKIVSGRPSILVYKGHINKKELTKNRISVDELIEALRLKDITDISTVQYAIMETNGQLSTILFSEHRPPTASELNGNSGIQGLPIIVISDGRWLDDNIQFLNLSHDWVFEEIRKRGVSDIKQIFLMMVDEQLNVYLQTTEDSEVAAKCV